MRRQLAAYTPEAAAKITGASPRQIRSLARAIARARAATAITQTSFSKFYHGMEMERAEILVMTLAGHVGRKGARIAAFPLLSPAGPEALAMVSGRLPPRLGMAALGLTSIPAMLKMKWQGYITEMMIGELGCAKLGVRAGDLPHASSCRMTPTDCPFSRAISVPSRMAPPSSPAGSQRNDPSGVASCPHLSTSRRPPRLCG